MSMARLVVTAVLVGGTVQGEVARDYGVSRRWVSRLVHRFLAEGEAGLEPRSRRPQTSPRPVPRRRRGRDRRAAQGPRPSSAMTPAPHTIAFHLERRHGRAPSPSTIWRVLSRRGFIVPQPHKRPSSSFVRFEADLPNERWQADITHWRLADRCRRRDPEHHRRPLPAGRGLRRPSGLQSRRRGRVFPRSRRPLTGIPPQLLTDNGAVFTGGPRGGGVSRSSSSSIALGVTFRHSRPYHPQTCGKVERFHQTLKNWLDRQPPTRSVARSQARLDRFPATTTPSAPTARSATHTRRGLPRPPESHRLTRTGARPATSACAATASTKAVSHPATQQPASPHRTRPSPRRPTRARPGPRPRHPHPHRTGELLRHSPSTPPPTTSHNKHRERCPATTAHDVSRHHTGAPGRIRTCDHGLEGLSTERCAQQEDRRSLASDRTRVIRCLATRACFRRLKRLAFGSSTPTCGDVRAEALGSRRRLDR